MGECSIFKVCHKVHAFFYLLWAAGSRCLSPFLWGACGPHLAAGAERLPPAPAAVQSERTIMPGERMQMNNERMGQQEEMYRRLSQATGIPLDEVRRLLQTYSRQNESAPQQRAPAPGRATQPVRPRTQGGTPPGQQRNSRLPAVNPPARGRTPPSQPRPRAPAINRASPQRPRRMVPRQPDATQTPQAQMLQRRSMQERR